MSGSRFVSPATAAKQFGVSVRTVTRWCRRGEIPGAWHVGVGGSWRIPVEALGSIGEEAVSEMSDMSETEGARP